MMNFAFKMMDFAAFVDLNVASGRLETFLVFEK